MALIDNQLTPTDASLISPWPTGRKWGFIGAGVAAVVTLLLYLCGLIFNQWAGIIVYLPAIAITAMCMLEMRKLQNGTITYGKCFSVGMIAALFMALVGAVWTYIFYQFIAPGVLDELFTKTMEKMSQQGNLSEEQIEQSVKMMKLFMTPVVVSVSTVVYTLIYGLIITAIAGAIIQRRS